MARKRKYKQEIEDDFDKKDFFIMFALVAVFGGLLTFQVAEERNFFKPIEVPEGYISWESFATTKEVESCREQEDDNIFIDCEIKPEYSDEILALDGKEIKVIGYMFPLTQGDNQTEFLLGPYPQSCPYHYHVGPSEIIEVHSPKGIEFSYEPVKLEGRFSAEFNSEFGVFYYLKDATVTE